MSSGQIGGDSTGLRGGGGPWNNKPPEGRTGYQSQLDLGGADTGYSPSDAPNEGTPYEAPPTQLPEEDLYASDPYSNGGDYPWDE